MKISKSILIIDDDQNIRDVAKGYLEEKFSSIFMANDALTGIDILKKNNISTVLVDINMPKISGFDFIEMTRNKYPQIKFIIITGQVSVSNLHRSIRVGAFDFIEKPFSQTSLLERVMAACKDGVK